MLLDNGEVFGAVQGLTQLSEKELPVKVSYWIARLINKLDDGYKPIDKLRQELVQKHGSSDPEQHGQASIKPDSENWTAFILDYNELMAMETEVDVEPVVLPIEIPSEVDGKELTVKPNVLVALEKFVKIEGM